MRKIIVLLVVLVLSMSVAFAAYGPGEAPASSSGSGDSGDSGSSGSSSGGGGGGGGGGGTASAVIELSESELESGVTKTVQNGDTLQLKLDGVTYTGNVDSVREEITRLTISGQTGSVSVGKTVKFDVTGDSEYDLLVRYDSYDSATRRGTLTFKGLNLPTTSLAASQDDVSEDTIQEGSVEEDTSESELSGSSPTGAVVADAATLGSMGVWLVVFVAVVVVGIAIVLGVHFQHNARNKKRSSRRRR